MGRWRTVAFAVALSWLAQAVDAATAGAIAQTAGPPAPGVAGAKTPAQTAAVTVLGAAAAPDGPGRAKVMLTLSRAADPAVFVVADPPRLIIDLANAEFRLPTGGATIAGDLITGFRYGLLAPGRSRIVVDLHGPAVVEQVRQTAEGELRSLVVTLATASEPEFRAAIQRPAPPPATRAAAPPPAQESPRSPAPRDRPLIVVDPGHGGLDPGAVGSNGVLEKDIVLAVARQVKAALSSRQTYDVVLTRGNDVFVPLDQRAAISEQASADLFLSIHADSLQQSEATSGIRGATVYTLSEKASDEQARRLAEKENAVDLLAGLGGAAVAVEDPVKDILIDLLKRETSNYATNVRGLLVRELGKSIALSREPARSAAFRVLRQSKTPAVLIELGYMSNAQDQALMATSAWQRKVAAAVGDAVDAFFAGRTQAPAPDAKKSDVKGAQAPKR